MFVSNIDICFYLLPTVQIQNGDVCKWSAYMFKCSFFFSLLKVIIRCYFLFKKLYVSVSCICLSARSLRSLNCLNCIFSSISPYVPGWSAVLFWVCGRVAVTSSICWWLWGFLWRLQLLCAWSFCVFCFFFFWRFSLAAVMF